MGWEAPRVFRVGMKWMWRSAPRHARGLARPACLMFGLLAIASLAACGGETRAAEGTDDGQIAFTANDSGDMQLCVMNPDGTNVACLPLATSVAEPLRSMSPNWSPDGTKIAFSGARTTGNGQEASIYLVSANGDGLRQLTDAEVLDETPAWSPDGTTIAFARTVKSGTAVADGVIMLLGRESTEPVPVTNHADLDPPVIDRDPSWSPDGKQIAFSRLTITPQGELDTAIYILDIEDLSERLLIDDASAPEWSPDGTSIAFSSTRDGNGETCFHECNPSGEIYVARADGSKIRRLTSDRADDQSPTWSPEGRRIAFTSDRSNRATHAYEIYVFTVNGDDLKQLTRDLVWNLEPDWR